MKDPLKTLHALARMMGVHTQYTDGLLNPVTVEAETLVRVCAAMGAPVAKAEDAEEALRVLEAAAQPGRLPEVIVAWDGKLPDLPTARDAHAELVLEGGERSAVSGQLPFGYHRLTVEGQSATVISAPVQAWRPEGEKRRWGVGAQLAALRSARSRSVGDLRDLRDTCRWVQDRGGDVVTVLPLLPTFNDEPAEPSPYSPVSRLFWSELMLDLGAAHHAVPAPEMLDVRAAAAEVRAALAGAAAPDASTVDAELARYARFRGAQAKMGRNWRDWPGEARYGTLDAGQVDADVERFHLVTQALVRQQLRELRGELDQTGFRLGLDLAVGVHPDGYDPWSRQALFAKGMSVGAPPDFGFPSGQDWGFAPVLPAMSRAEGHRYVAASIAHQASLAGLLRVDHIMAWTRLYWIPHGLPLHQGTYVNYPAEELFAVLTLESHRHRCEVVGENLGTVPKDIDEALPRHHIRGMYLAEFQVPVTPKVVPPTAKDIVMIGTHDTPTFAGWLEGNDIDERLKYHLMAEAKVPLAREERQKQVEWLAEQLDTNVEAPREFLGDLLAWLGASDSALVTLWLEDLWLETRGVNLPGTPSSVRPNWQMPMRRLLDDIFTDPEVAAFLDRLHRARHPG